jgi:pyruvate/2-oxoglutarate dehydrogenase complex dihydrolipoamide acyltransferase (E2) component
MNPLTEVRLPQWGMDMREGTVTQWLLEVGDWVDEDDEMAEVETSKAVEMVIAPCTGKVTEIKVEAGTTVEIGTVLCLIEEDP